MDTINPSGSSDPAGAGDHLDVFDVICANPTVYFFKKKNLAEG